MFIYIIYIYMCVCDMWCWWITFCPTIDVVSPRSADFTELFFWPRNEWAGLWDLDCSWCGPTTLRGPVEEDWNLGMEGSRSKTCWTSKYPGWTPRCIFSWDGLLGLLQWVCGPELQLRCRCSYPTSWTIHAWISGSDPQRDASLVGECLWEDEWLTRRGPEATSAVLRGATRWASGQEPLGRTAQYVQSDVFHFQRCPFLGEDCCRTVLLISFDLWFSTHQRVWTMHP